MALGYKTGGRLKGTPNKTTAAVARRIAAGAAARGIDFAEDLLDLYQSKEPLDAKRLRLILAMIGFTAKAVPEAEYEAAEAAEQAALAQADKARAARTLPVPETELESSFQRHAASVAQAMQDLKDAHDAARAYLSPAPPYTEDDMKAWVSWQLTSHHLCRLTCQTTDFIDRDEDYRDRVRRLIAKADTMREKYAPPYELPVPLPPPEAAPEDAQAIDETGVISTLDNFEPVAKMVRQDQFINPHWMALILSERRCRPLSPPGPPYEN
jgi:hypothetical protein